MEISKINKKFIKKLQDNKMIQHKDNNGHQGNNVLSNITIMDYIKRFFFSKNASIAYIIARNAYYGCFCGKKLLKIKINKFYLKLIML